MMARRRGERSAWVGGAALVFVAAGLALWWGTRAPALPPIEGDRVGVDLAGERFVVELAADPVTQHRGLSGRNSIDPAGGMLFAYPVPQRLQFVMRDCLVPIDIAFLDRDGRVLAVHAMGVERPRQPWESQRQYELRLPRYTSPPATSFALELAGGRLAQLGVEAGSQARFDIEGVLAHLRR